ncbi:MAG: DUF433 domain-containing protein [Gemmatimonadetes bacterium]|nr:DUF433 domain-containing protein [Gemmatimonadota bacterium]
MSTKARGLRLPAELERDIKREGSARGQSWSATALELLSEGVRMRRAPGIVFADGATGRRAVVAGTGLDVWEIIAAWHQAADEDFEQLKRNYPWLSEAQLKAALGYYELYPEEIDARLQQQKEWTLERVRRELPFATPRRGRK